MKRYKIHKMCNRILLFSYLYMSVYTDFKYLTLYLSIYSEHIYAESLSLKNFDNI